MALNPVSITLNIVLAPVRLAARIVSELAGSDSRPESPAAPKDLDDVAIARKVESIIFRDGKVAKGKVDVNVANGVVSLRGEVATPERIKRVVARARDVPEVRGVENLLHLPKTPVPRKARRTSRSSAARKATPGKVSSEAPAPAKAEPSPRATAASRRGRRPAPLGSVRDTSEPVKAEPSPRAAAASRTGRRPAPLGSKEPEANGPDTADLDKDPAYNPPPGLRDIKGG
jgi:hypothetical protein